MCIRNQILPIPRGNKKFLHESSEIEKGAGLQSLLTISNTIAATKTPSTIATLSKISLTSNSDNKPTITDLNSYSKCF